MDSIYFKGEKYDLKIYIEATKKPIVKCKEEEKVIKLYVSERYVKENQETIIYQIMREWLIQNARVTIEKEIKYWTEKMQVEYGTIRIKEQKTRWGSCSGMKNLNFNWHLIQFPPKVLQYVVVHELCHLKHMNHSNEFWDEVFKIMPDYEKSKMWLKNAGTGKEYFLAE